MGARPTKAQTSSEVTEEESCVSATPKKQKLPLIGPDSIMRRKQHGTSSTAVQQNLRWGCDRKTADRICSFNRHAAEHAGYFSGRKTSFLSKAEKELKRSANREVTFYDSVTGKPLFHAPRGRTWKEFVRESKKHGWPSFRDDEVNWEVVRCLRFGETVSMDGTHLGHNIPDQHGNRYCINLVSIAGRPEEETSTAE